MGGCRQFFNPLKILSFVLLFHPVLAEQARGQKQVLDSSMHNIRIGDKPEWEEFHHKSPLKELTIKFTGHENLKEQTLQVRQYDVKQSWQLVLNGNKLGNLVSDVNDMIIYFSIPANTIVTGDNTLQVLPASTEPDDIMAGEIILYERPLQQVLNEAKLDVEVTDKKNSGAIPCRITIVNENGALQMAGAEAGKRLAVRPGNIYSIDGKVTMGLPAGKYTIYAGQGFEYSVDSIQLIIKPGERLFKKLTINREVNTEGWISADPHIHTNTYSGHGDATIHERALTIAGEGIELPIITDHNVKVDLTKLADSLALNHYYTPVTGMEFTTNLGHFNVFPVSMETPVPNPELKDWDSLTHMLNANGDKIIILNHARDTHKGFRPFDQAHHLATAGMSLSGWNFPANAMEVLNSGSLQTNDSRLLQDWMGMINRGHFLTPVGSSDSHDVSRYLVGQARTYIRVSNDKPGEINKEQAIKNFRAGKAGVSLGLFTRITINNKYGAGELVLPTTKISVTVQVLGPGWTSASRVSLYANGKKIREAKITGTNKPGVKWEGSWVLPKFKQDVFLVAIAEGPYSYLPFWPLVKPFQPVSTQWTPVVIGSTGAAWIDSDGDGLRSCAFQYANLNWQKSKGNINTFIRLLNSYDQATAVQAASILVEKGWSSEEPRLKKALSIASPDVKKGFQVFFDEWAQTRAAR